VELPELTKLNIALMASTAIAVANSLAVPTSAQDPAAAPGIVASQKKVKLSLYGQISRLFGLVGDGESKTFKQGENENTSTRMGIHGQGRVTNGVSVETRMEFSVKSGSGGGGTQFENQGGSASRFDVRHLDAIVRSKKFGSVFVGRGNAATKDTMETHLIPGAHSGRLGGNTGNVISSAVFLDESENLAVRSIGNVGRFFKQFDGAGRQNRIRYDTPTYFGFKGSGAIIDKNAYDFSLWYQGKIGGTEMAGSVGWCHTRGSQSAGDSDCWGNGTTITAVSRFSGSVSAKTPIGLGATVAWAFDEQKLAGTGYTDEDSRPYNVNPAIWYATKVTELGPTAIEYAYQYCKHCGLKGDVGRGHAVTLTQVIDRIGGDYFLGFRYFDVETPTNDNINNLWWVGGGFRQRF
jgi:hypothetical protein